MVEFRKPVVGVAFLPLLAGLALAQDNPFGTEEDQQNLIAGICSTQLDIGPAGCVCLAERSMAELDEGQRGYLILSAVQPPAADRLPIARDQAQLAFIFQFLERASGECRAAGGAPADLPEAEPAPQSAPAPETPPAAEQAQ